MRDALRRLQAGQRPLPRTVEARKRPSVLSPRAFSVDIPCRTGDTPTQGEKRLLEEVSLLRRGRTQMKFYGHFAAAYGTIWLLLLGLALITQSHVDAGAFGFFGFPLISLVYAWIRAANDSPRSEVQRLRQRVAELEEELARRSDGDR